MTLSRYRIDEEGRECSKCGEYKAWAEYHKNKAKKNGHQSACKVCLSNYSRERAEMRCEICDAPVETKYGKYCEWCKRKVNRLSHGNWYLVLRDPSECSPFLGRMLDELSLKKYGLPSGHMPEGMLLQHILDGKTQGLHVVRGKSLKVQWLEAVE